MSRRIRPLTVILLIIGLVILIVGIIYFTVPAKSLPSFIPGRAPRSHQKHTRRGIAGVAVAAVVLLAALASYLIGGGEEV